MAYEACLVWYHTVAHIQLVGFLLAMQTAGLESLQEQLQVPNHRIPLSAKGVQESLGAGLAVQQLLSAPPPTQLQQQDGKYGMQQHNYSNSNGNSNMQNGGKLFLYTSPFLRCIQTAQHITRALEDEQVSQRAYDHCRQLHMVRQPG